MKKIIYLVLILASISCSSTKIRSGSNSLIQDILYSRKVYDLNEFLASGEVYQDYKLVISSDGLLKNENYAKKLVDFGLDSGQFEADKKDEMLSKTIADTNKEINIILICLQPDARLNTTNFFQQWNLDLLVNNEKYTLSSLETLKPESMDYKFIQNNSSLIDRWSSVFNIKFYKNISNATQDTGPAQSLNDSTPNNNQSQSGKFELKISGPKGNTILTWNQ